MESINQNITWSSDSDFPKRPRRSWDWGRSPSSDDVEEARAAHSATLQAKREARKMLHPEGKEKSSVNALNTLLKFTGSG
jgi:hypothetical protein